MKRVESPKRVAQHMSAYF